MSRLGPAMDRLGKLAHRRRPNPAVFVGRTSRVNQLFLALGNRERVAGGRIPEFLGQVHALSRRESLQGGEIGQSHAENFVPVLRSVNRFLAQVGRLPRFV